MLMPENNCLLPFYKRTLQDRIALTESAIRERRTLIERWAALGDEESCPWNARAAVAAALLRDQPVVADFGCGMMHLEKHLLPEQRYLPVDVVARDSRTIVCDLNREELPTLAATAVCFLGVLEYLHDVERVVASASRIYTVAVVSYCPQDAPGASGNRREHGWVNDYSSAEFEQMILGAHWTITNCDRVTSSQTIWRLQSTLTTLQP
jgi:hypothetical protein